MCLYLSLHTSSERAPALAASCSIAMADRTSAQLVARIAWSSRMSMGCMPSALSFSVHHPVTRICGGHSSISGRSSMSTCFASKLSRNQVAHTHTPKHTCASLHAVLIKKAALSAWITFWMDLNFSCASFCTATLFSLVLGKIMGSCSHAEYNDAPSRTVTLVMPSPYPFLTALSGSSADSADSAVASAGWLGSSDGAHPCELGMYVITNACKGVYSHCRLGQTYQMSTSDVRKTRLGLHIP